MFKVGLTGGIASGKTTVSDLFSQLAIPILDADIIARELVRIGSPTLTEIIHLFGNQILTPEGNLNRRLLRQHIFDNPKIKQQLESILHPKIHLVLQQRSDALSDPYCILVIPLLIEAKMTDLVNSILTVETEPNTQQQRLQQRDNIDLKLAESMIQGQTNTHERQHLADDIIHNNNDLKQLKQFVATLHQHYLKKAKLHSLANSSKIP